MFRILDIDECSSSSHSCDVNGCRNTRGSYFCKCKPGYSGDGKNCTLAGEWKNKNWEI